MFGQANYKPINPHANTFVVYFNCSGFSIFFIGSNFRACFSALSNNFSFSFAKSGCRSNLGLTLAVATYSVHSSLSDSLYVFENCITLSFQTKYQH